MNPELSIVMPCYNEEGCIEAVTRAWIGEAGRRAPSLEVIVVDDGSRDQTGAILDRLAQELPSLRVIHQPNSGHGRALRVALEAARGEWVFHVDSDDQFDPRDFWKLWNLRNDYDYLCGYRVERHDPVHRLVISDLLRGLNRLLFGVAVRDANVPFKLIRRPALERILSLIPRGVFAPSIMMSIAGQRLFRFREVAVSHRARQTGRISIVRLRLLRACLQCAKELWAFRAVVK